MMFIGLRDDVTGGAYMPIWQHVVYVIFKGKFLHLTKCWALILLWKLS